MTIQEIRRRYHRKICRDILGFEAGLPNIVAPGNKARIGISKNLIQKLGYSLYSRPPDRQTASLRFCQYTVEFLNDSFRMLEHIRPGMSIFSAFQSRSNGPIFDQHEDLFGLSKMQSEHPTLSDALWRYCLLTPDITIGRAPVSDAEINCYQSVIGEQRGIALKTRLRAVNMHECKYILHASITCKLTVPNACADVLSLIRNRKGHTPHIIAVTAEPLPTRLASIAMGTGDIDCVYHMALTELAEALKETKNADQIEVLTVLIEGRRLRDISDLPFDLSI
jgi:hypothetical protein